MYNIDEQVPLYQSGNVVGYLLANIVKSQKEEVVGGLHPPVVSLRHGAPIQ